VARHERMDRAYHFTERELANEAGVDAYVQTAMMEGLDRSYPPWRMVVLRVRQGRSGFWFRAHHTMGDGLSMLFAVCPMLGCKDGADPLSKIPLPGPLLPPSARKQQAPPPPAAKPKSCCGSCGVGSFLRGVAAPLVAKHDAELSINPPLDQRTPFLRFNRQRACFRFPAVSMSTVSAARKRHDCSVNDILLAALTGTLRRYGAEVHNDERLRAEDKRLEFKTMLMMALPRKLNEQDMCSSMCNNILFASCPLPIDTADMDERVRRTVEACVDLKSKAYMTGLIGFTNFVKGVAPLSVLRKAASETFSKHTLLVTNVPSTTVPVTFPKEGGAEVDEIQMVFPNVITQVSIITYNGKVCANIVADPALFPRMDDLGAIWESELAMLSGSPGKA